MNIHPYCLSTTYSLSFWITSYLLAPKFVHLFKPFAHQIWFRPGFSLLCQLKVTFKVLCWKTFRRRFGVRRRILRNRKISNLASKSWFSFKAALKGLGKKTFRRRFKGLRRLRKRNTLLNLASRARAFRYCRQSQVSWRLSETKLVTLLVAS